MEPLRSVALVGRPNVGKSRLFNRLAGRRIAIVHDQPGVTRDVNSVEIDNDYILMDTGGIGLVSEESLQNIVDAAEEQVFFAVEATKVILFVVDGIEGLTPLDEIVAERLRKSRKEVLLVINKIDTDSMFSRAHEFKRLGFGDPILVSAEHDRGTDLLKTKITQSLGPRPEEKEPEVRRVKICFAGRPNVGKSSLCNHLLKSDRLVVSEVAGTTRDAVELNLDYTRKNGDVLPFRLVDTAGLRKFNRVRSPVEYFSIKRTEESMEKADIVFIVLDAMTGVTDQDKKIAGSLLQVGKTFAVIVNKWDFALETFRREPIKGYEDENEFRNAFEEAIRKELFFLPDSPILFVSAKTGFAMESILETAHKLDMIQQKKLPTAAVNQLLERLFSRNEPRIVSGRRFKVYYGVHVANTPFRIRLFCNRAEKLDDSYQRYLEKAFVSEFGLTGCPVKFSFTGKEKRFAGQRK